MNHGNRLMQCLTAMLIVLVLGSCTEKGGNKQSSFIQIGEFTVKHLSPDRTEVRDGAGRTLVLIPRGAAVPDNYEPHQIVRIPVERVVAYGLFDVAILRALGVLPALVGVTQPAERWQDKEILGRMHSGKIAYLGDGHGIDFERLKHQRPELVLTWDHSIIPMLTELGIPCAITTTPVAMCLDARMRFVQYLAPFFLREKEADAFFARVNNALLDIREQTAGSAIQPRVMWGDIYEKRVMVEPGNAWVGELIHLAKSDYLFEDVYGTSCIEISVERFLYSGQDADIFFTYRTARDGVTSKAALTRLNPMLADIRPIKAGRVYTPLSHYSQSGDRLDEILTEIAAILHPDVYPNFEKRFFVELPAVDPEGGHS